MASDFRKAISVAGRERQHIYRLNCSRIATAKLEKRRVSLLETDKKRAGLRGAPQLKWGGGRTRTAVFGAQWHRWGKGRIPETADSNGGRPADQVQLPSLAIEILSRWWRKRFKKMMGWQMGGETLGQQSAPAQTGRQRRGDTAEEQNVISQMAWRRRADTVA